MAWTEQTIDYSIKEKGLRHVYNSKTKSFIAVAYPIELGPLKHIYQNELYAFDLLSNFEMRVQEYEGKKYYMYEFPEKMTSGEDVFEFLWNDK